MTNQLHKMGRRLFWIALFTTLLVAVMACSRTQKHDPARSEPQAERRVLIFAAASLREAFTVLSEDFERAHPGVEISFNFAGSQELRTQIEHGAGADVFASADQKHMAELVRAGRVTSPRLFARNEPVIVVSREAAGTLRGLGDLPNAERLVIGAPDVPIGRYTAELLDRAAPSLGADFRARVEAKVVSRELNVKQVLLKVRLGEAEAGIVYRSDALATPDVSVVELPKDVNVVAEYPIAVTSSAGSPGLARAWVELVRSNAGQSALRRAGFLAVDTR